MPSKRVMVILVRFKRDQQSQSRILPIEPLSDALTTSLRFHPNVRRSVFVVGNQRHLHHPLSTQKNVQQSSVTNFFSPSKRTLQPPS